jgi:uncharacterized protein YlzI (FlbEa/FlbD family)
VIRLRRLGHNAAVFYLNPDLIVAIEATPDTVVTLTTHTKVIVSDSPEEVVAAVKAWRAGVLTVALPPVVRRRKDVPLSIVRGASGDPQAPVERDERR